MGEGSVIRPPFDCDYGHQIHIGSGCFTNFGMVILDVARVDVGDEVQIGPHVQTLTATHPLDPEPRRAKWESPGSDQDRSQGSPAGVVKDL